MKGLVYITQWQPIKWASLFLSRSLSTGPKRVTVPHHSPLHARSCHALLIGYRVGRAPRGVRLSLARGEAVNQLERPSSPPTPTRCTEWHCYTLAEHISSTTTTTTTTVTSTQTYMGKQPLQRRRLACLLRRPPSVGVWVKQREKHFIPESDHTRLHTQSSSPERRGGEEEKRWGEETRRREERREEMRERGLAESDREIRKERK